MTQCHGWRVWCLLATMMQIYFPPPTTRRAWTIGKNVSWLLFAKLCGNSGVDVMPRATQLQRGRESVQLKASVTFMSPGGGGGGCTWKGDAGGCWGCLISVRLGVMGGERGKLSVLPPSWYYAPHYICLCGSGSVCVNLLSVCHIVTRAGSTGL